MGLKAIVASSSGGAAAGITIGTSVITGGTNTRVLFDDNGVVGESAGFVYVKATGQATATLLVATTSLTAPLLQAGATGGTIALSTTAGQGPTIAAGTATTDVAALTLTRTNNNSAVATGVKIAFTDTTSASGFLALQVLGGASATTNLLSVDKSGNLVVPGMVTAGVSGFAALGSSASIMGILSNGLNTGNTFWRTTINDATVTQFGAFGTTATPGVGSLAAGEGYFLTNSTIGMWLGTLTATPIRFATGTGSLEQVRILNTASANRYLTLTGSNGADPVISTSAGNVAIAPATNQVVFSPTAGAGTATSRAEINKQVTGIADNTATATFTITIPNAAHSGSIKVILTGSMGAGNLGANESTQAVEYDIDITRIAGANAVAAIGAAIGLPGAATTAGGDAVAVTAALSAIAGAVGVTNTFTINVTIAKVGIHSQTNHTCLCYALLMNANSTGITIS